MIGILHSGDLKGVSSGGISEYVRQFIQSASEPMRLFGTDSFNVKDDTSTALKHIRQTGATSYEFLRVCTDKRRPITLYYVINMIWLMVARPYLFKDIDVFYSQRMEFVLPFTLLFRRKRIVFAVHGSSAYSEVFWGKWKARIYLKLEQIAVRRAAKVFILNSNPSYGLNYYQDKYSQYRNKFEYVRVPVDSEIFELGDRLSRRAENSLSLDKPLLLYVGRLEDSPKRVLLLPEILMTVRESVPEAGIIIIGDGGDQDRLLQRFTQLGLNEHVYPFDYIHDRERLASLIGSANVSLIISSFEGICMSALESLSAGVPLVGTDVGELPQYINSGVNGMIIPNSPDDSDIVRNAASAVVNVLTDETIIGQTVPGYEMREVFNDTLLKLHSGLLETC